jgi:tungstate transport system ATP-binding protein
MNDSIDHTANFVYRLQNISKEYEGRRVLQVDHLKIERGEVFALVGPSGAGKSTPCDC